MQTTIIGFPRIGANRELKFSVEKYFKHEINQSELIEFANELKIKHWKIQQDSGLDFIPSNDFSFYDTTLDTSVLFNIIPQRVRDLELSDLDKYFALARGYQGDAGDVKALAMKKWFNTNYHYLVPEIDDETDIKLAGDKIFADYQQAKAAGVTTRPVLLGPYTLLKLATYKGKKQAVDFYPQIIKAYQQVFAQLTKLGASWLQIDEPALVLDLTDTEKQAFIKLYAQLLNEKGELKILLETYFGDLRDIYSDLLHLDIDGLGVDFIEGRKNLELVTQQYFPQNKTLFAGVVNGKNIWKNHYAKSLALLEKLPKNTVISTSCSLLHVPFSLASEEKLSKEITQYFSLAVEKLTELQELKTISQLGDCPALARNKKLFSQQRTVKNEALAQKIEQLSEEDFIRAPRFSEREALQKEKYQLPLLPTTTIGSFPQTAEVKKVRRQFKTGEISQEEYIAFNQQKIAQCVAWQEQQGFDVLVHGEFERNDMVEYFGEHLDGYLFTQKAWVQSYGTRCVKPPIIWGDITRSHPISVFWSQYAQSLTEKPMKGMLTGPVTILNWSFPREDVSLKETTLQLALAIQDEVLDLEKNGVNIIQIDEAALREKLPLRKSDWYQEYLDWAIPAFRLVHSKVKPETQIHTHMCYSEFTDIIDAIDGMDADVISFEASRSNLQLLDALRDKNFQTQVGPGVYDIHSPRIPSINEIKNVIYKILDRIDIRKVWINPDCGLKTRAEKETQASLIHLIEATKEVRKELSKK